MKSSTSLRIRSRKLGVHRDGAGWHTHTRAISFIASSAPKTAIRSFPPRETELYAYLAGIARSEGFPLVATGGTSNHVHLLIALPASASLAQAVQKLKGSSSRWMGEGFSWQEGYGAFSVSPSQVKVVKGYIQNQEEHHRKRNFEQEFVTLLRNCGIAYDERYVFG